MQIPTGYQNAEKNCIISRNVGKFYLNSDVKIKAFFCGGQPQASLRDGRNDIY